MLDPIYITFATEGKYETYLKKWCKNMSEIGIDYRLDVLPDLIGYNDPVQHKKAVGREIRVKYIIKRLVELDRPMVWLDCDDFLSAKPKFPDVDFDFGYIKNTVGPAHRLPFMAGFLVFRPTKSAIHFLKVWDYLCAWDDLEPMRGNHIRLIHAYNICSEKYAVKHRRFKTVDFSQYVLPYFKFGGNRCE